jgi:hypothetical protein
MHERGLADAGHDDGEMTMRRLVFELSRSRAWRWTGCLWLAPLAAGLLFATGCGEEEGDGETWPTRPFSPNFPAPGERLGVVPEGPTEVEFVPPGRTDRPLGATEFASADATQGQTTQNNRDNAPSAGEDADFGAGDERTVEEGDIYRVLSGHLILNLNSYRGLQVIDFSDVENPEIIGRLQVSGYPVELYVVGSRAFILLNHWRGYWGSRTEIAVDTREGGLVASIDLSDPTNPVLIDQDFVPGWIQKSRLTRGGGLAALYVVTGGWAQWLNEAGEHVWESRTVVKSFDVSDGSITARSELNLGGYIADIQATPEALLVARNDWNWSDSQSRVSLIDISDPRGAMVQGDTVTTQGWINNQFNMDLRGDVLRVVSGSRWWSGRTNYVQTFDASDFSQLTPIDMATFGDNEDLYATLFLENKAFFVTYRRVDPFHAFALSDSGEITEMSEFIVSGWNDFFRAVYGEDRLIGIGVNDEGGRQTLAVSLYDIEDLTNPHPLVSRAEVEADYSWSEANWDHRAFSVLENAVEIAGPDGAVETGLVLLPFSGWSDSWREYTAAVQIFTFSESSLTRRGLMVHGTPVRRSFAAGEDLTANLSEAELSLFDTANPAAPVELGRVDLAPNYTDVMVFGDYRARVQNSREHYYSWWGGRSELPPARVELVPASAHPDHGAPVATFEIPADATVYQSGDYLVASTFVATDTSSWPYTYETTLRVFDLSDPTAPVAAGTLVTDRLQPGYGYYDWYWADGDCFDCGYPYYWGGFSRDDVQAVPGGLAFLQRRQQQELIGREEYCYTWATEYETCWETDSVGCGWYSGSLTCRSLEGAEPYCTGDIRRCTWDGSVYDCTVVDPASIATQTHCYTYDRYRYWQHFTLEVLDLTDPAAPSLAPTVDLGEDNEGVSMLTDGSIVWITTKRPYDVAGDSRP